MARDAQNEWAAFRLEAVRKAGRTLASMRAAGLLASGHGGDRRSINATLIEHLGAPSHQAACERANRWQRLAAWPEASYRTWVTTMRALPDAEITEAAALRGAEGSGLAGLFLSEETEWLTPRAVLDRAVVALGAIDLDPCADAGRHVRATTHFTVSDDGLAQPWHGRVFMNPPYGREVGLWVAKLAAEVSAGHVTEAITLVSARTDTAWWRTLPAHRICFAAARLTFSDADAPAPFPSAIAYAGPRPDAFVAAFSSLGPIYAPVEHVGALVRQERLVSPSWPRSHYQPTVTHEPGRAA